MRDKFSDEDREALEKASQETLDWLDEHPEEKAEVYEERQKEMEAISNPIMTKMYSQAGGEGVPEGMPGGMPGDDGMASGGVPDGVPGDGPKIEEVD